MLDKPSLKKNSKKRQKKQKNTITVKIRVRTAHLLSKTIPMPTKLTKNNMAPTKHTADFYIPLKDAILSWTKKKIK